MQRVVNMYIHYINMRTGIQYDDMTAKKFLAINLSLSTFPKIIEKISILCNQITIRPAQGLGHLD